MSQNPYPSYPWPASAITPDVMALLYQARAKSSPRVPINRLLADAVRTAFGLAVHDNANDPTAERRAA